MMADRADVVICGAGIAGVSAAYHLAARHKVKNIVLLDQHPPLTLTSDHSTECYRNWWPGPGNGMTALTNRSIDLLEEMARQSRNVFQLNRRGYLYCTTDPNQAAEMQSEAETISGLGAGSLRIHREGSQSYLPAPAEDFEGQPTGADLLLDRSLIQAHFPYLSGEVVTALHVRRAGWLSAQQLGMYMLEQARAHGVQYRQGKVTAVERQAGRIHAVRLESGETIQTGTFVNAAGPFLDQVGQMLGLELPVHHELHLKAALKDPDGILHRSAPLVILNNPQTLDWSAEERALLAEDPETRWLLDALPGGAHTRPEGGADSQVILLLWEYHTRTMQPVWPIPLDEFYPEIVLRGITRLIPKMAGYIGRFTRPALDGGYYTRTLENRPLVGPLPVEGAYLIGALSGFGIMVGSAAGELLAAHVTGAGLPEYAPAFTLARYQDAAYLEQIRDLDNSGQL